MKKILIAVMAMVTMFWFANLAHAAFVDNGGGLIYDTDYNITWFNAPAVQRNWANSMAWVSNLSVTDAGGNSITGWRLPNTVDGSSFGYDGTTAAGFNITTSEMGHLYYTELGNISAYDTNGYPAPEWNEGLINKGPFTNLQPSGSYAYWSGTLHDNNTNYPWFFYFNCGEQLYWTNLNDPLGWGPAGPWSYYALAVHEGNISGTMIDNWVAPPVPIPASVWLFGSGLAGLIGLRRKFKK